MKPAAPVTMYLIGLAASSPGRYLERPPPRSARTRGVRGRGARAAGALVGAAAPRRGDHDRLRQAVVRVDRHRRVPRSRRRTAALLRRARDALRAGRNRRASAALARVLPLVARPRRGARAPAGRRGGRAPDAAPARRRTARPLARHLRPDVLTLRRRGARGDAARAPCRPEREAGRLDRGRSRHRRARLRPSDRASVLRARRRHRSARRRSAASSAFPPGVAGRSGSGRCRRALCVRTRDAPVALRRELRERPAADDGGPLGARGSAARPHARAAPLGRSCCSRSCSWVWRRWSAARPGSRVALALWLAVPVLFFTLVPSSTRFFGRYLAPAEPVFYLLVAAGCLAIARRRLVVASALAAGVVALSVSERIDHLSSVHDLGLRNLTSAVDGEGILFSSTGTPVSDRPPELHRRLPRPRGTRIAAGRGAAGDRPSLRARRRAERPGERCRLRRERRGRPWALDLPRPGASRDEGDPAARRRRGARRRSTVGDAASHSLSHGRRAARPDRAGHPRPHRLDARFTRRPLDDPAARDRALGATRALARYASPGSPATGSGMSSANGTRVPPPSVVRQRCEKNRVIRTPARNSPSVGSGRSPFASWSASSG